MHPDPTGRCAASGGAKERTCRPGAGRVVPVLTISSGHSADYLLNAVATGRENYYTGAVAAGEPQGRWYGRGAEALGLRGFVDHQDMTALYERLLDPRDERFRDPAQWDEASTLGHNGRRYPSEDQLYEAALDAEPDASAERRAELRLEAGKAARHNVAFLDATFSVSKSVTVLHTAFEAMEVRARAAGNDDAAQAWAEHRKAVEDAIWAGNNAGLDYLSEKAGYSRVGHHGGRAGRWIDAHDWTVASFFQHDSRDHDPQLHIHNAILNRVQGPDGKWRTLDGRSLFRWRTAAAAVAERTTEARLARTLGLLAATRPDGKAREIVGVSERAMELFSSRRRAITPKTAELAEAFEQRFGRAPNTLELDRLARQATFATRRTKSHGGESAKQRLERWETELRAEIDGGMAEVAHTALNQRTTQQLAVENWSPAAVIETALADVQQKKAGWTIADLTRAISDALPDHLGNLGDRDIARVLDTLAEAALDRVAELSAQRPGTELLPDELKLANGTSAYEAPGGRLYATPEHVHTERILSAAAGESGAAAVSTTDAQRFVDELAESGIELGADQAAAVRGVLTSGARIESLIGPAGTGKSFVVGVMAKAWQDPALWSGTERRVFGLASSQIATDVLAGEGLQANNITRWLDTQARLGEARGGGDDAAWRLRPGDLVVVDESSMANTADLAAVHRHVDAAGAKLLLVGDHRQLAAVGAGGGMDLIAHSGASYELAEARRFTHEWEREATLRLRDGDQRVLGEYHKHGRLIDAGTREQSEASAAGAWLGDTLDGKHSLLIVDTNEQADRLCASLRAELVRLGRVDEAGVPLGLQGTYAGVGDLVQARLNGWSLAGYQGNRRGPINRENYRVLDTRDDGGLVVARIDGRADDGEQLAEPITLPGSYVSRHVALGYACTVHASEGLTVDTSHPVVSPATGPEALYVELSRGRHANTAHVVTTSVPDDPARGGEADARHRSPTAVVAGILEAADPSRSALATAAEAEHENTSVRTPAELLADAIELATAGRTARWLDTLVDDGLLTDRQRATLAAEDGAASLSQVLRRAELAGRDPEQVLRAAVAERELDGARQLTNVLHHRIAGGRRFEPVGDTYAEWTPKVADPEWQRYLDALAEAADERREDLGAELADEPPPWAVEALGLPPEHGPDRIAWGRRAGAVAAHRELTGHDDEAAPLGPAPMPGQAEEYASWRAAWRALGRPDADREELELSDGQLRMRVRAYEREKPWAPRYVANELAATRQAAETHRQTASLRTAEAENAVGPERERLQREAIEASALADTLDGQASDLDEVDQARSRWLAHTAATRANADRAAAELAARRADDVQPEPEVTAEEWLAIHDQAMNDDDMHRDITETDIAAEHEAVPTAEPNRDVVDTATDDIRAVTAAEPAAAEEDEVRVPSADESADSVEKARRALREIEEREASDAAREAEDNRSEQLTRWHAEDQVSEHAVDETRELDHEPVLDMDASR